MISAAVSLKKKISARIDLHTSLFSGSIRDTSIVVPTMALSTVYRSTGAGDAWNAANIFADLLGFEDDERLLTILGVQAAVAIEKAKLTSDLQDALEHEKAFRTQLVQAEKLAALGRIVASVAHELNNPLQAIQNALFLIQMEETLSIQTREDLKTVLAET